MPQFRRKQKRRRGHADEAPGRKGSSGADGYDDSPAYYQMGWKGGFTVADGREEVLQLWMRFDKEQQLDILDVTPQEVETVLVQNAIVFCDEYGRNETTDSESVIASYLSSPELMTPTRVQFIDAVTRYNGQIDTVHNPLHWAVLKVFDMHLCKQWTVQNLEFRMALMGCFWTWWAGSHWRWMWKIAMCLLLWGAATFKYSWLVSCRAVFLCLFDEVDPEFINHRFNDLFIGISLSVLGAFNDTSWYPEVFCLIPYLLGFYQSLVKAGNDVRCVAWLRRSTSYVCLGLMVLVSFKASWFALIGLLFVFHWDIAMLGVAVLCMGAYYGVKLLMLLYDVCRAIPMLQAGCVLMTIIAFLIQLKGLKFSILWTVLMLFCGAVAVPAELLTEEAAASSSLPHLDPVRKALMAIFWLAHVVFAIVLTVANIARVTWALLGHHPLLAGQYLVYSVTYLFKMFTTNPHLHQGDAAGAGAG
ncbi:unnamed protein product [Vitrella brassicaformis CCMP3155]|uniref:Uncharacterized protein n=2 Tax=Vitrella brassicaformis TaxID=1169539 RepID=A0A0G4EGW2_VITBC|nr:unnamed protein product [Vitrella brassicaformis CCMP3155]|mmetsp:Transcript_7691/g.21967  ORF Transcript_7691/g.21967 Transcript_7691/m.21967 type:complete len:473 (+) Transcript_7691:105-1523(+)|eukprot:CEL94745.1 unnamed protein product [Vitrella brassicaformis CCMP3155]